MGFQQSFRGGVFGGEGFVLQKIGGPGRVWIDLQGEVVIPATASRALDAGAFQDAIYSRARFNHNAEGPGHGQPLASGCRRAPLAVLTGPGQRSLDRCRRQSWPA